MKIYAEQLWALVNAQKLTRPDLKLRVVQSDAKRGNRESLPDAYLRAFGERNTASGRWRYLSTPPFMLVWNLLRAQGHTKWRNESGIDGLTTAQARENSILKTDTVEWQVSETDVSTSRFGLSSDAFQRLRWRGSWQRRRTQGWSMLAFWFIALWRETRKEHEGWAIGCPRWWEDHQP